MGTPRLEHVNITFSDPVATARMLCDLFDWCIRWQGPAALDGTTVHVGGDDSYLAVYTGPPMTEPAAAKLVDKVGFDN